jgi:uncharacterized protein (DUF58 family)
MMVPCTRLIALVAAAGGTLALAAAVFPPATPLAIAIAAMLAAVAAWDGFAVVRAARGLSVSAPVLLRAVRGRVTTVPLTLANRKERVRSVQLALQLPPEFTSTEETIDCGPVLEPGSQIALSAELRCARRGEYEINLCAVRTESRLALWAVQSLLPLATIVRVYPDLLADPTAAEFLHRRNAGARAMRHAGKGREFEKLREYLSGDAWDEIDWKATARRGKPVVRVFQIERTQEIYVALDASRLSGRPAGDEFTLERYVHAALAMALAAEEQGDRLGLITFSDRVHGFVRANKGKAHFKTCREAIYKLQPRAVEPDFGEFFAFLATRLTRRALVIVLTALDDPLAGENFSHHVSVASRRHLVIAGMPAPEGARPLFEAPVKDIDDVYEGLSGHLRWRQLAELKKSCEHKGVALHLLAPQQLTGQLAGIYLDVKRRQRL